MRTERNKDRQTARNMDNPRLINNDKLKHLISSVISGCIFYLGNKFIVNISNK